MLKKFYNPHISIEGLGRYADENEEVFNKAFELKTLELNEGLEFKTYEEVKDFFKVLMKEFNGLDLTVLDGYYKRIDPATGFAENCVYRLCNTGEDEYEDNTIIIEFLIYEQ